MLIKEMVPSNTSCQAKGRVPFSLLMRTRAIFTPPRGWTVRSRPTTRSEPKRWTGSPTSLWSPSRSSSSRFRTSTTTSPISWMAPTLPGFRKCLLWVSKEHTAFAVPAFRGVAYKIKSPYVLKKNHISVCLTVASQGGGIVGEVLLSQDPDPSIQHVILFYGKLGGFILLHSCLNVFKG